MDKMQIAKILTSIRNWASDTQHGATANIRLSAAQAIETSVDELRRLLECQDSDLYPSPLQKNPTAFDNYPDQDDTDPDDDEAGERYFMQQEGRNRNLTEDEQHIYGLDRERNFDEDAQEARTETNWEFPGASAL